MSAEQDTQGQNRLKMRADKWLWHARFVKTRSMGARLISGGHLRVNGIKHLKPSVLVGTNDVLTFPQGNRIRVVRVLALSTRRGSAVEARVLFDDLTLPVEKIARAPGFDGPGRPSGKDRRNARLYGPSRLD